MEHTAAAAAKAVSAVPVERSPEMVAPVARAVRVAPVVRGAAV
jgi:hypothetical protein